MIESTWFSIAWAFFRPVMITLRAVNLASSSPMLQAFELWVVEIVPA
ncbi:hypothetical protein [Rhizobium wenxiniae]|nr:hypothetical protein [Rhizobium wenxiniae]